MDPRKYFDMLIDWKKLPAYRLETRIDSILGYYLKDILQDKLNKVVSLVIPEFPLRKGTLNPRNKLDPNRSEKADFYVRCQDGVNLLIEVKSASASRRVRQDEYLRLAQEIGMAALIEGLRQISTASRARHKYAHLRSKLLAGGLIDEDYTYTGISSAIQVIYIQPKTLGDKADITVIDFRTISEHLTARYP